jgi:DNA mismatch endonuclease Vsr
MSRIRSKGSIIENLFEVALRKKRFKFKKHYKLIGKPDFVILSKKAAIFCDSSFWHGFKFLKTNRHKFKSNKKFWIEKITANIRRDKFVTKTLRKQGWKVFRFWDFLIKKDTDTCIAKVITAIKQK